MASGLISTGGNLAICAPQKEDPRGIIVPRRVPCRKGRLAKRCLMHQHLESPGTD